MALHITDDSFKATIAKGPSIVDFSASWCGPCKMMAPIFDQVSTTYTGKVAMGKLDIDESPATSQSFGISGVPTVIFFKDGVEVHRLVGFQSKDALVAQIAEQFGVR